MVSAIASCLFILPVALTAIRAEIGVLVKRRLSCELTPSEQRRYTDLTTRERNVLAAVV